MLPHSKLVARGLARRRQDALRMKAKARRIYPDDPKARNADHLAMCSCLGCGNERNWTGKPSFTEVRQAGERVARRGTGRHSGLPVEA